mgnify:CR=1 FL=1
MLPARGTLSHIKVLDITTFLSGPYATQVLADLGAEVIKVEPPGGCEARRVPPFAADAADDPEASLFWAAVGGGKRSLVLDIVDGGLRSRLLELIDSADVFIESADPGFMASLGLDYPTLSDRNPRLVYVSITPYGQEGPDALKPATDLTVEAASCMLGLQGDGDRPPVPIGYPQPFFHASAQAAADAVCALHERDRSGLGQHLDVSAQAAMIWVLLQATGYPSMMGEDPPRSGEHRADAVAETVPGFVAPAHIPCADGRVMFACASGPTLNTMLAWMAREDSLDPSLLVSVRAVDLGALEDVPLALTDLAVDARGRLWFSAAAEDTASTYDDGPCKGSVIGLLDADFGVASSVTIPGTVKVEGICFNGEAHAEEGFLVADPDDPTKRAPLYRFTL